VSLALTECLIPMIPLHYEVPAQNLYHCMNKIMRKTYININNQDT
jgi:hypothetical protein